MTILVVGDANADLSATLARFPHEGDDSPVGALDWGSGGSAANVAAALALIGAPARLLARVGRDPAAEIALRAAQAAGVDLTPVQRDDTLATGLCFAAISPGGERTFFSFRGANAYLAPPAPAGAVLAGVRRLHIAGHALLEGRQRTTALELIAEADRRGLPISLDLCLPLVRAHHAELIDLLPRLDILFANELELAALAPGLPEPAAIEVLLAQGTRMAAIKLGPRGCILVWAGEQQPLPAFAVEAIDSNGCGDAFVAGFLRACLDHAPPEICARLGNALGALAVTRRGAAEALPDRARLRAFLNEHMDGLAFEFLFSNQ